MKEPCNTASVSSNVFINDDSVVQECKADVFVEEESTVNVPVEDSTIDTPVEAFAASDVPVVQSTTADEDDASDESEDDENRNQ